MYKAMETNIKMLLNKSHASWVGENSHETKWLTSDIPTYNTVYSVSVHLHVLTFTSAILSAQVYDSAQS